jgi:hypothetical protein
MRILHNFLPGLYSHIEAIVSKGALVPHDTIVLQGLVSVITQIENKQYVGAALTAIETAGAVSPAGSPLSGVATLAGVAGAALVHSNIPE